MEFLTNLPVPALAAMIFFLRIVDVSIGTIRTVSIVQGMVKSSVILGFFEVLVWIVVVSQVISRINDSLFLVLAYAGGFAAGNAVGILIERRLAFGMVVLRMFSPRAGNRIAETLRGIGQPLTTFDGEGRDGPVTLIYIFCERKRTPDLLHTAKKIDPDLFYVVERANDWSERSLPHHQPSGLFRLLKQK